MPGDVHHDDVHMVLVEQPHVEAVTGHDTVGRDQRAANGPARRRISDLVGELGAHVYGEDRALFEGTVRSDGTVALAGERDLQGANGVDDVLQFGAVEVGQLLRLVQRECPRRLADLRQRLRDPTPQEDGDQRDRGEGRDR